MNPETLKYINKHQLTSVMNKTKWRKLENALNESDDFVPNVRYKLINEENPSPGFSPVWWDEMQQVAELIEWLEVDPIKKEMLGRLIPDKKTDFSCFIVSQLENNSIPYSIENGMYRIWGYLRAGESPKFVSHNN